MAYSGTLVAFGQGRGVVVATGAMTEIGRIGRLLADVEGSTTPLLKQMAPVRPQADRRSSWAGRRHHAFGMLVRGQPAG